MTNKEEEKVILVDRNDTNIGLMSKMEAHQKGLLHRAFSVFIFNDDGELLLQKRASHKYHSPNQWTNTCCSHQRNGESNIKAGKRRLFEEMGFNCELEEKFSFIYKASFNNGLTEHELDHVMIGKYNNDPIINLDEVGDFCWMSINGIKIEIRDNPDAYTVWFKIIFQEYLTKMNL